MEQPGALQPSKLELAQSAIDWWVQAFKRGHLIPGTITCGPVGVLLCHYHGLQMIVNVHGSVMLSDATGQRQHEEAYVWESLVREHGLAAKSRKSTPSNRPLGELLSRTPLPLAALYEIEMALENAAPSSAKHQANVTEYLFNPEITLLRLQAALHTLCLHSALTPDLTATLQQQLLTTFTAA